MDKTKQTKQTDGTDEKPSIVLTRTQRKQLRRKLNKTVREFMRARLIERIAAGEVRFTFDSLITQEEWGKEPLFDYVRLFHTRPKESWKRTFKRAYIRAGRLLYDLMKADGHFELSYYEKKEDKRGKARLYVLKSATQENQE